MPKLLPLFLLLLLLTRIGYAQPTRGDLALHREKEKDAAPVIALLKTSEDTNRVNALNKIARIYWYQKSQINQAVDSVMLYANAANALSKKLNFTEGSNESLFMMCKAYLYNKQNEKALQLASSAYGEEQVRMLLVIAESYVFHFPADEKQLKIALPIIEKAKSVSLLAHSTRWTSECANLLAKLHFNQGQIDSGKRDIREVINMYHRLNDFENEAKYWSRLGTYLPENALTYKDIIYSHNMAVKYYLLAGNKKEAGYSLRDLAVVRANHGNTAQAGRDFAQMQELFQEVHESFSTTTYYFLAEYYRFIGSYDQALNYGLLGIKAAGNDRDKMINPCIALAAVYGLLKDYRKALHYYHIVLDYQVATNKPIMFVTCYKIANVEAESGNPKRALAFLNRFLTDHPAASVNHQELFASTYGAIYSKLGRYKEAEHYYHKMLNLDDLADQENGRNLGSHITLTGGGAYFLMGKFYIDRGRYSEGKPYLLKSLDHPQYFDKDQELVTYKLLFKADSAMGNYLNAILSLERHKALFDSINSVTKANQISALNIRYETAQKAKDIKLLENKQKLQHAAVQRSETVRNFSFAAALLLLLFAGSAYTGYYNKKRVNNKLKAQQEEINAKNAELEVLLAEKEDFLAEKDMLIEEKDSLLKEKDWLLKEVHHRVKNNLQIIMSLLRTQLTHLKTEDAKDAIIESENRVQAIALIHQKLYTTDKLASISMPAYISDLVNYLGDSLDAREKKVRFYQSVDPVYIDLAQAVPLGLILNEAITNAVKYGYQDTGVEISIIFRCADGKNAFMSIADKGPGLPDNFDVQHAKSLGMQMMKGLTHQLKGKFEIINNGGVTICVSLQLIHVFLSRQSRMLS